MHVPSDDEIQFKGKLTLLFFNFSEILSSAREYLHNWMNRTNNAHFNFLDNIVTPKPNGFERSRINNMYVYINNFDAALFQVSQMHGYRLCIDLQICREQPAEPLIYNSFRDG